MRRPRRGVQTPRGRKKRDLVTIQTVERSQGEYAEVVQTPETIGQRFATVVGRGGKETQRANQTVPEADYLVEFWPDELTKTLTPDHRLVWNGKDLGIAGVDHTRWHEGVVLCFCESRE